MLWHRFLVDHPAGAEPLIDRFSWPMAPEIDAHYGLETGVDGWLVYEGEDLLARCGTAAEAWMRTPRGVSSPKPSACRLRPRRTRALGSG